MTTRLNRRPISQIDQLRKRSYEVSGTINHRYLRAQNGLSESQRKALKEPEIVRFIQALVEYQANIGAVVILDWLVGEGLTDERYRRYFTDAEELDLFMPFDADQLDTVRRAVRQIDTLRRDERYDLHNLPGRDYSEDTIDHWVRRYWKTLESSHGRDENLEDIYVDLSSAIAALPAAEKKVAKLLCDGWTLKDIAEEHGVPQSKKVWSSAKRKIVEYLTQGLDPKEE